MKDCMMTMKSVLNLVISGIPSILVDERLYDDNEVSFKPCYKWNTFNTVKYVSIIKEF